VDGWQFSTVARSEFCGFRAATFTAKCRHALTRLTLLIQELGGGENSTTVTLLPIDITQFNAIVCLV
jgi:hypothetical protein